MAGTGGGGGQGGRGEGGPGGGGGIGGVVRGQGVWLNLSRTPKFSPESPECPQIWGKLRKIVWKYSNCLLPTQPRASVSSVLDVSENGER
jgi:hypothetical protein